MQVVGIGVDLLHVPRILALLKRRGSRRLALRILSPMELSQWEALSSSQHEVQVRFLAVR
jgi:holo-[acyl-carrier protein] synthase